VTSATAAGSGSPKPRATAIITTKNRSHMVVEAVESALAIDTSNLELEIIVVDDGSTDDTLEVLATFPVKVVHAGGVGMAAARAAGVSAATGDYVALLDDDDMWLPPAIAAQVAVLEQHPEYGAVHGQSRLVTWDKVPFGPSMPAGPLTSGWIVNDLLRYFPQIGTIVTRTSVARSVGDMDSSLPGDPDWDWVLRVAERHQIGRIEVPVVLFRQRGEPEEEQCRRRFPAMPLIFKRHTAQLSLWERIRVRPILWRHRGWCAGVFLNHAGANWRNGRRRRALRSISYAVRWSPPHTAVEGCRRLVAKVRRARSSS
jgi:glycosyltransferase involved in cell wall biosynthesis